MPSYKPLISGLHHICGQVPHGPIGEAAGAAGAAGLPTTAGAAPKTPGGNHPWGPSPQFVGAVGSTTSLVLGCVSNLVSG